MTKPTSTLLHIDFSFFCTRFSADPAQYDLFDWDLDPSPSKTTWYDRAVRFIAAGVELPSTTGMSGFWNRFSISKKATLQIAESRLTIMNPLVKADNSVELWNFDTIHSLNDDKWVDRLTSDNWATKLFDLGANFHQVYPQWRNPEEDISPIRHSATTDRGFPEKSKIPLVGSIFLSHSSAECPPWCEADFLNLIKTCPAAKRVVVEPAPMLRGWSEKRFGKYQEESQKLRVVLDNACKVRSSR